MLFNPLLFLYKSLYTITANLNTESKKNKINRIFGLIFTIIGIIFIYDSSTDFFKYNFTSVLFVFMRSNSSIIAEFIFGILLIYSGIQLLRKNKKWLNILRILTIGILVNILFDLSLRTLTRSFDLDLIGRIIIGTIFGFGIYKLTEYLIRMNNSEWNFKTQKLSFIIGIGLFPFLFRNVFFN